MKFSLFGGSSGESASEGKARLERDLALQRKANRRAEAQIEELKKSLEEAESQFRQASIASRSMVREHSDEITTLGIEHSKSMGEAKRKYDRDMSESKMKYDHELDSIKQEHDSYLLSLKMNHGREVNQLKQEISKLVGQLLVNQDETQGWPDDKLKLKFRELQRLIDSVTSPRNREFQIPMNQQLGSRLDPNNFLSRVGRGKSHFLLKSTIWAIFHEQFFSAPFGFGVLGPGQAQRELMRVYLTWRRLFDDRIGTTPPNNDDFEIFHQDRLANKWRSANFQCINVALTASGESSPTPTSPLARLSADNVRQAVSRIMSVLSEVSNLSNSSVGSEVEDEIRQMANLAREIALQFGIHSAQLRLSVPNHGEQVQIGEEFHDCKDGDFYRGSICAVDLVIVPGLQKIGDERSDMSSKRIIIPCEIYPDQPPS